MYARQSIEIDRGLLTVDDLLQKASRQCDLGEKWIDPLGLEENAEFRRIIAFLVGFHCFSVIVCIRISLLK